MPSTVHRSMKAAVFVFVSLLIALIGGLVLYFRYAEPRSTGVPLLAGCAIVVFLFAVLAIRLAMSYRKSRKLELEHNVPPSRLLRALELRQWLTLTLGIAFFAAGTGALTALSVVADDDPVTPPVVVAAPTTEPTVEPTTPSPSPSDTPSDTPAPTDDPTDEPSAEATVEETPDDTPATRYLDAAQPLDGSNSPEPVTFKAERFPHGFSFYCGSHTGSRMRWNVAGYKQFTTTAGIDDNAEGVFGVQTEFIFYDQDGHQLTAKPVGVSVGHPRPVTLDLKNVVSLRVTCASRVVKTNDQTSIRASFGDPVITQ